MRIITAFLAQIGRSTLSTLAFIGQITIYLGQTVSHLVRPPFYLKEFGQQLMIIGYFSLPVVGLTAVFTGAALALQIFEGGSRFNAESVVPSIVAIGMVRKSWYFDPSELISPVLRARATMRRMSSRAASRSWRVPRASSCGRSRSCPAVNRP